MNATARSTNFSGTFRKMQRCERESASMRWQVKPKKRNIYEAHRWYAWHPVYVKESRTWVWCEEVIRRREGCEAPFWFYRLPSISSAEHP